MAENELTTIEGVVESITFHNEETGFTVMQLDQNGELVSAVGEMQSLAEGEKVTLHGQFATHPTYGMQFKAKYCERTLPATAAAIQKYLASGAVKGIGPVLAARMVSIFGDDTLTILEKEPQRLIEVPGISPSKLQKITEEFRRMFGIRAVMMFLTKLGLNSSASVTVWKKWGTNARKVIEENPYVLLNSGDIPMDFETCDEIAYHLNIPRDSGYRIEAMIFYTLRFNSLNGHTCIPASKFVPTVCKGLGQSRIMVEKELNRLVEQREILELFAEERQYYYLPELYEAERQIVAKVEFLLMPRGEEQLDYTGEIAKLEQAHGIQYASLQKEAIQQALNNHIFILTGGPGTGKTTAINAILELSDQMGRKVTLCAPTGRAAKRMSEVTGWDAKTIHRLLEVDFSETERLKFKRNEKNPLPADVVIVDEVSMVDIPLMCSLLCALRMDCRLILVGDSDQLPSVGPGLVLRDLIGCGRVPKVCLTEIFRQAQQSLIVTNAHAIVRGEMPDLSKHDNDFFFLRRDNYEQMQNTVVDLCSSRLPRSYGYSPLNDIQVIAPTRIGPVGTNNLNSQLQEALNPPTPEKEEYQHNGRRLRIGDKVMQVKNNYDIVWVRDNGEEGMGVYNGDIGIVEMIDRPSKTILVRYDDRVANYLFEMADQLELAYAITVHKSQGSEFEAVVMPLMHYHSKMHYRNLLYTAVTRAKKNLIILGKESTVAEMVKNDRKMIRYTNLKNMLEENG